MRRQFVLRTARAPVLRTAGGQDRASGEARRRDFVHAANCRCSSAPSLQLPVPRNANSLRSSAPHSWYPQPTLRTAPVRTGAVRCAPGVLVRTRSRKTLSRAHQTAFHVRNQPRAHGTKTVWAKAAGAMAARAKAVQAGIMG